jgi:hypothetical protein
MIEQLFEHARILHQTPDDDLSIQEMPFAACLDSTGIVCISQEGRHIVLNRASVAELCKMLRELVKEYQQ